MKEVHVSRTVIPENRLPDIPIRVMNVSQESKPFVVHTDKIKTWFLIGTTPMSWLKSNVVDCSPTMEDPFLNKQTK